MDRKLIDFQSAIKKYGLYDDEVDIAVGIRPSGRIHLGNMATLAYSGYLGKRIGPHISNINVTICDLELPDIKDRGENVYPFVKYYADLPDPQGEYKSLLESSQMQLKEFFTKMEGYFKVKIKTKLLSEIQRNIYFRKGLKELLEDSSSMRFIHPSSGKKVFVFPLCPDCNTSSYTNSTYLREGGIFKATCRNPECGREAFDTDIFDVSRNIAVHYFIDPIRDCWVEPRPQIHIFGGDYKDGDRNSYEPKIKRIINIMKRSGGKTLPNILVGPKFFASDGYKMSKGKDNGLTLSTLKKHFGNETFEKIFKFVEKIADKNMKVLDYSFVNNNLL